MDARARRDALDRLIDQATDRRVSPGILQPAELYFDLAGEDIGRRLMLTAADDGTEYCLRPEFTLAVAADFLADDDAAPMRAGYLGPVFRKREAGPAEFDQGGIEILSPEDGEAAFSEIVAFALEAAKIYGVEAPRLHLGAVDLFEALIDRLDMPDVWRPRIRHRLGHPDAMAQLLDRLASPEGVSRASTFPSQREKLIEVVAAEMSSAGLSPISGRQAEEVADRYLEKRALAEARVPEETVACLRRYLAMAGPAAEQLEAIGAFASEIGIDLTAGLDRLAARIAAANAANGQIDISFDAGFSPRLDYYTGHVFELLAPGSGDVLASGGRYDRLLERLGAPEPMKAVGCAVWVDRLEGAVQ
jgi:ATP phosphoribosyltransferase regulatory subunit